MFLWFALCCSVAGAYLVAEQNKIGYVCWSISNSTYLIYAINNYIKNNTEIQMCFLWMFFLYTCVIGYRKLNKK